MGMATETASTGRESDKFMLRFPEGMRALIKEAAEKNGRTMNAEIVARLEASFKGGAPATSAELAKELAFVRHLHERQAKAQELGQRLLASGLLVASAALPPEIRSEPTMAALIRLAEGIDSNDGAAIVQAFTAIYPRLDGAPVVDELREVAAKHKRGEDITPDLRRHLDETRAAWEAKQDALALRTEPKPGE